MGRGELGPGWGRAHGWFRATVQLVFQEAGRAGGGVPLFLRSSAALLSVPAPLPTLVPTPTQPLFSQYRQEVRPKPRASAPSWLPRHLLGSQTVLCPCGPLQSRARASPGSQSSPSLAQVWLKEPQHVSSILTPSSTSLSHPEGAEAKLELNSHSPSNPHPRHKRIFSGGSFR